MHNDERFSFLKTSFGKLSFLPSEVVKEENLMSTEATEKSLLRIHILYMSLIAAGTLEQLMSKLQSYTHTR